MGEGVTWGDRKRTVVTSGGEKGQKGPGDFKREHTLINKGP